MFTTTGLETKQFFAGILATLFLVTAGWSTDVVAEEGDETFPWVVEPARAAQLIESGEVAVLDTRSKSLWKKGRLPGAVRVDWENFTPSAKADRGELLEDTSTLQTNIRKLGIDGDRPVLVVGNPPENWGEDGRIVWMLRTLGHERVGLVDGGHEAVLEAGLEPNHESADPEAGNFEVDRRADWSVDREQVRAGLESDETVLLDTRSAREYAGKTSYGEARGGHLPGAKHLHYRALLREDGRLLPKSTIRQKLEQRGITPETRVVAYCTGGVRSAWMTVVLRHLGYTEVANYAGSAWDWASADKQNFPLEKSKK